MLHIRSDLALAVRLRGTPNLDNHIQV